MLSMGIMIITRSVYTPKFFQRFFHSKKMNLVEQSGQTRIYPHIAFFLIRVNILIFLTAVNYCSISRWILFLWLQILVGVVVDVRHC